MKKVKTMSKGFPTKFDSEIKPGPGRPQTNASLSQNKDRIATNHTRLRQGWPPLNPKGQMGIN